MPRARKPRNDFTRGPAENTHEPAYVALTNDGEFVDADDDLAELARVLSALMDSDDEEDLVIWAGATVAAVIQSDGTVTRFDRPPQQRPPPKG